MTLLPLGRGCKWLGASVVRWGPAVAWMSFIFYLSSQAQLPGPEVVPAQSYLEHLVAYAILGALLQRAFHSRSAAAGIIWGSLYGVSDELHQHFVPPRTASAADLLTDVIGVVCGALLFARLRRQD